MAVTGLRLRRWRSIGLNLTAAAAEGSVALLFTALADIRPQEAEANLNGKQEEEEEEKTKHFADTANVRMYFTFSCKCFTLSLKIPDLVFCHALVFSLSNAVLYSALNMQHLSADR